MINQGGRNNLLFFVIQLLCLIAFFFSFSVAKSASPTIIINEVCWAGSSKSSSDEWIELKNVSDTEINIKGWEILAAGSSGKSLYIPNDRDYVISPGQFFLIANYDLGNTHTVLNIKPDIVDASISLSNQGNGSLILKNTTGIIIDEALGGNWPSGNNDNKMSMERIDSSSGIDPRNWQSANTQRNIILDVPDLATPKVANSQSLFNIPGNYPTQVTSYINLDNALEAQGMVTRVIDADTIEVSIGGANYKVRLIGVDSPEGKSSSAFNVDEPYFSESKQFTTDSLLNQNIRLLVNANPDERFDNYKRLLAIIINNDEIFNLKLLTNGLARSYFLDNHLVISNKWQADEELAKSNHLGLWRDFGNECIAINELMPNPAGSDSDNEWIELINNCDTNINIKNWFLDDKEGGSDPYLITNDNIILPHGYLAISAKESHLGLNNDADSVRLFSPDLNITSEVTYSGNVKENYSYAFIDQVWQWSNYPTPGKINSLGSSDDNSSNDGYKQITSLDKLKDEPKNTLVYVSGFVNVTPSVFGKQYFYIQDDTGGTQIYFSDASFPSLSVGDLVTVKGEISNTPYLRIKINSTDDIRVQTNNNIINAREINDNDAMQYEGMLIQMRGIISDKKGRTFYIGNNKKIKIQFKENVKMPKISNNDTVEIVGVLSIDSHNNIILLPRSEIDIRVGSVNTSDNQIKEIYNQEDFSRQKTGTQIKVKGVITAVAGMIDDRYMYIQTDNLVLQIYNSKKQFPALSVGDEVVVIGKISSRKGRLIISRQSDINIISSNNQLSSPELIDQDIGQFYQRLVKISGTIISKKGNTFVIYNGKTNYQIYLKNKIKSQFKINVGDYIETTGIVEKYQDQFKITARAANDIYHLPIVKSINQKLVKNSHVSNKNYFVSAGKVKGSKYLANRDLNQYNSCTINNLLISLACSSIFLIFIIRVIIYATNVYYKKNKRILSFH